MTLKTMAGNFQWDKKKQHERKEAGWLNIEVAGSSETSVVQLTLIGCHHIKTGSMSALRNVKKASIIRINQ
jgi:hypothetical protein